MVLLQDSVYEAYEADDFYVRCEYQFQHIARSGDLRDQKKDLFNLIQVNCSLSEKSSVLEIGCFIGDLLAALNEKYKCQIQDRKSVV